MKPIERIVSLAPSMTEILYALGLGSRVVGVTALCDYPPEARQKPKVGDVNISPEKVVALKPDLVVAHSVLNARVLPTLQRLKLRVLSVNPNTFEKLFDFMLELGRVCAVEPQARRLVNRLQLRVRRVQQESSRRRSRPRVLFAISVEPLWASGRETFADSLIRLAGGQNALGATFAGFCAVSLETALTSKPDLIILTEKAKAVLLNDARWQRVPAVVKRQVYEVNPDIFLRETPRLVDALEHLARLIARSR